MQNRDILEELDLAFSSEKTTIPNTHTEIENNDITTGITFKYETIVTQNVKKLKKERNNILAFFSFIIKYSITCTFIFGILMVGTNYSAYFNIAKSYILKEEMEEKSKSIINSVEASNLKVKSTQEEKTETEEAQEKKVQKEDISIRKYKKSLNTKDIKLDIEITPYENRVLIPKIGKNIPLLEVQNRKVKWENELEAIFMKELEKGVVRYPGSALPGEEGNSFIFGHSSNSPWIDGNYNDVFATLNNLEVGDEIIIYYNQKKYVYKAKEKKVISPGDVSILKRDKKKKEITIMTCWPIGTDYNRLIVIWELVEK